MAQVAGMCAQHARSSDAAGAVPRAETDTLPGHGAQQARWGALTLASMWLPTVDISTKWAAQLAPVSEFLEDTLTTSMVTLWATAPALAVALYICLVVWVAPLRTVLAVYL
ncbi:hypothetical protein IWQ57_005718, partial [Coemansia nantahalensis]